MADAACEKREGRAGEEPGEHHRPLEDIRQPAPLGAESGRGADDFCRLCLWSRDDDRLQPRMVCRGGTGGGGQPHRLLHLGSDNHRAFIRQALQILHDAHARLQGHHLPLHGPVRPLAQGSLDV